MLTEFKAEPLIATTYQEVQPRVEEIRNILWSIMNYSGKVKFLLSAPDLREVTKKLLVLMDDPLLILKTYLKLAKEKMYESPFQPFTPSACVLKGSAADKCGQYLEFIQREEQAASQHNFYLNYNFWNELKNEMAFFSGLLEKYRKNPFRREKDSALQEMLKECGRETVGKLNNVLEDSLSKFPVHLAKGLLGKLHGEFPMAGWLELEEKVANEKAVTVGAVIEEVARIRDKARESSLAEGRTAVYSVMSVLKDGFGRLLEEEVLSCCLFAFCGTAPITNAEIFLSHVLERVEKIIREFLFFLAESWQQLTEEDLRSRLPARAKRSEYAALVDKLTQS
jgi:hypothetical protein